MISSDTPTSVLRRANGRLQACDRCRARKVACDHARPICGRCKKRKVDRTCTYTLSATSFETSSETPPRGLSTPSNSDIPTSRDYGSTDANTATSAISQSRLSSHSGQSPYQANSYPSPGTQARSSSINGYQGYTSLATVINETLPYLVQTPHVVQPQPLSEEVGTTLLSPHMLDLAKRVLNAIPPPSEALRRYGTNLSQANSWLQLIGSKILPSIYENWSNHLGHDGNPARLQAMAQKISVNTRKPVLDFDDGHAWLKQFSGPNLRWESLGILFIYWRPPHHPEEEFREAVGSRLAALQNASESISQCLDLALANSANNYFVVQLSLKKGIWESLRSGDAGMRPSATWVISPDKADQTKGLSTWRQLADCVSLVTFLGLHADTPEKHPRPSLRSESERRTLALVYNIDKVSIAFTGRPPLLSHRFVSTPSPLDLSDEDLFLSSDAMAAKASESLNNRGWNKTGKFYSATTLRARNQIARVTDQIAEVALGRDPSAALPELYRIQQEHEVVKRECPPQLLFKPELIADHRESSGEVFVRLLIAIETLQNEFFLHRLFIRHGQPHDELLLSVSFDLVTLVLHLWTNKDRFDDKLEDFTWLLVGYGASPGGLLCKTLLQARHGKIRSANPNITRSAIIQKLSLLVGFLDWVRPSAPNADLCRDAKSVIQRVLDQVLDSDSDPMGSHGANGLTNDPNWSVGMGLDFNFDLMDTYDWLRDDPMSL